VLIPDGLHKQQGGGLEGLEELLPVVVLRQTKIRPPQVLRLMAPKQGHKEAAEAVVPQHGRQLEFRHDVRHDFLDPRVERN